jgi:hypothetical protein
MATRARHARRLLPLAALAAAVLALVGLAQTQPGEDAREALGLAEPPERFTELGFADPHELPDILTGPLETELAFEIHNQEGEERSYRWVADFEADGRVSRLAAGTATVPDGAGTLVSRTVTLPCDERIRAGTVTVRLAGPAREIRFAVQCVPEGP